MSLEEVGGWVQSPETLKFHGLACAHSQAADTWQPGELPGGLCMEEPPHNRPLPGTWEAPGGAACSSAPTVDVEREGMSELRVRILYLERNLPNVYTFSD